jgi:hypothetical protein
MTTSVISAFAIIDPRDGSYLDGTVLRRCPTSSTMTPRCLANSDAPHPECMILKSSVWLANRSRIILVNKSRDKEDVHRCILRRGEKHVRVGGERQ